MFDQTPFIRYVAFLIAGILIARYGPPFGNTAALFGCGGIISLGILMYAFHLRGPVFHCVLFSGCAGLGFLAAHQSSNRFRSGLEELNGEYAGYVASIRSLPEKRGKTLRYEVRIREVFRGTVRQAVSSRALLYIPARTDKLPSPGDLLVVSGKLRRPPEPSVPFEFDYAGFLENKGIAWTGYVSERDFTLIRPGNAGLQFLPLRVSEWADRTLRSGISDNDAYGLVKAMLLGRRDDIPAGLYDAFIGSGTIHILSVSGLHVGIFFMFINILFGALRKRRATRPLYVIIVIGCLSFYALVTGLPPSVQRAVVMAVFWVLADFFTRRQHPVNTLSIAAFILLLAEPFVLFDIGFQLSFLAMLGIFLLFEPLAGLYEPASRIGRHLWQVSALSVAAQLMTFPLSVFHFHQFPTYFLPVNLLVVDIAGLLLPAALVFLLLSLFPFEAFTAFAGEVTGFLAMLTNKLVMLPEKLPGFLMEGLYLDGFQLLLLFLFLYTVYTVWKMRHSSRLKVAVGIALSFCIYTCFSDWYISRLTRVECFGEAAGKICLVKARHKVYLIADEAIKQDTLMYERKLKNYVAYLRCDTAWIVRPARGALDYSVEAL